MLLIQMYAALLYDASLFVKSGTIFGSWWSAQVAIAAEQVLQNLLI